MKKITSAFILILAAGASAQETFVDEIELSSNTNISVAAGDILKIGYLKADSQVVVAKTGAGKLVLASVGGGGSVLVEVQEGTLASAKPGDLPQFGDIPVGMHVDVTKTSTLTILRSNGTNYVSKIVDAAGSGHSLNNWWWGLPYLSGETLNGLPVLDFGAFKNGSSFNGNAGMLGNTSPSVPIKEYFFVWKDRDDTIDAPLVDGQEFSGPCVIGSDPSLWTRNLGGNGSGFGMYKLSMSGAVYQNMRLDGRAIDLNYRVPRGFHVFHNRITSPTENKPQFSTLGYSSPYQGGFVLAELLVYSNLLSQAEGEYVEAYLSSKWFGAKLDVKLAQDAVLDVSEVKFNIGTMEIAGEASLVGASNFCCRTIVRGSTNVVVNGLFSFDGSQTADAPAIRFEGDALLSVSGAGNIDEVRTASGKLVKSGSGTLTAADVVAGSICVEEGALCISPLSVRSGEFHVDAAKKVAADEVDGRKLVSRWEDVDGNGFYFTASNRKPNYDTSRTVRRPYLTEGFANGLPVVDFGSFADANHVEGWGALLESSKSYGDADGVKDVYVAWADCPDVKNLPYAVEKTKFYGPCLFGAQYYWYRGAGGAGESFPMHYSSAPGRMYGDLRIDGTKVSGTSFRPGDGMHVLAQRITSTGAPMQQIGGNYQTPVSKGDGAASVAGVFGGLRIGEVLMFKTTLSDRRRLRLESQLCAKWLGKGNVWEYDAVEVAESAAFDHPYADLAAASLKLAGKISAKSVAPGALEILGPEAEIDGALRLDGNSMLKLAYDAQSGSFMCAKVSSLDVVGRAKVEVAGVASLASLAGREFRVFETEGFSSRVKLDVPGAAGMKAYLTGKDGGVYLSFEPNGLMMIVR